MAAMSRGAKVLYCVYLTLLMGFTGFVTLDTFVIARVETMLEAPQTTQTPSVASAEPTITENSYQDEHISIQIDTRRLDDTTVYIADVTLSSLEYLKTALAQNAYGKNVTETTSAIAERQSAILAINGDYYGSRERGYVLRNGTLYRITAAADQEDLVIFSDGSFAVIDEGSISADSLLQQGAMQVLSFARRWWRMAKSPYRKRMRWARPWSAIHVRPLASLRRCTICLLCRMAAPAKVQACRCMSWRS